jgi:hypothetical protein
MGKKTITGDVKEGVPGLSRPVKGYSTGDHRSFAVTPEQASFRKRVSTILGGKHVDYVSQPNPPKRQAT